MVKTNIGPSVNDFGCIAHRAEVKLPINSFPAKAMLYFYIGAYINIPQTTRGMPTHGSGRCVGDVASPVPHLLREPSCIPKSGRGASAAMAPGIDPSRDAELSMWGHQ